MKKLRENWYWLLAGAVILGELAVFLFFGEDSYIAVHDNLDLFMGHFQAMNHWNAFWGENMTVPILGGITRDYLSSEFSLYNILYYLLPPFAAYMSGYFLKILIAIFSVYLLAKDIYGKNAYRPAVLICGLIYGLLPLFPTYGIAFASIPLVIVLLRRIWRGESRWNYLWLFLYPLLSYFSYFGFFILAYLVAAILILWVREVGKKQNVCKRLLSCVNWRLVAALFVLAIGYVIFEYRLFREMLFSDTVSMRSTMVTASYSAKEILGTIWEVFTQAIFHAQPSHTRFMLPLCAVFYLYRLYCFFIKKEKGALTDGFCLTMYFILANCVIYGLYYWEGFRELLFSIVPQLQGFQFNRTVFFNPFLWYAALFFIVKYFYDHRKQLIGNVLLVAALAVVILTPAVYNDFYYTCYYHAYEIVKGTQVENLSFREFYSEELFDLIKEDIGYDGEFSIAYGMHPAVLSYNGIATLDGYLGFYTQEYKEDFGELIAPATERVEEWDTYFWDWGARAYIFSGSGENTWNAVRTMEVSDDRLYINGEKFREMGGTWLFSRIQISNADELGMEMVGGYGFGDLPYSVYVYRVKE